eukprot:Gb_34422 [translate_table: standard]
MAPPKPWERVGNSSGPSPFRPASTGSTSAVVESSGVAKLGENNTDIERTVPVANRSTIGRPMPTRPWEQNYGSNYGGYGSMTNYNSGYGSMTNYNSGYGSGLYGSNSLYGGTYGGGLGGTYGGGLYGNNMNRGGYGGPYGLGGMYNNGIGGPMGGYGMGPGGPYDNGNGDPNNPFGGPPSPPNFWQSMLRVLSAPSACPWCKYVANCGEEQMHGVVTFFGRISILVDQNTQAFHFFITALLQLFDRTGVLYGELARFVLRLLGIRTKKKGMLKPRPGAIAGQAMPENYYSDEPKDAAGAWDNVWEDDGGFLHDKSSIDCITQEVEFINESNLEPTGIQSCLLKFQCRLLELGGSCPVLSSFQNLA